MEIIHCSPHTTKCVCFKSCLELQETNKLKQRKQLVESRLHEWMWPQTPQERTWRQPVTQLFCPQNRIIEQALSDSHQEILAYIGFILSQHPESSFWWLTGRGRILQDALCMCSKKNGSKGALRMVMSQYVSLRLPWRPGRPAWSLWWPSQMGVPGVVCEHCRFQGSSFVYVVRIKVPVLSSPIMLALRVEFRSAGSMAKTFTHLSDLPDPNFPCSC